MAQDPDPQEQGRGKLLDRMSLDPRRSWRSPLGWLVVAAVLLALLAGSTAGAAPMRAAPGASAAKTAKCNALIQKGKKLVAVYERVWKFKFVKLKGSNFKRKLVHVKQKLKVPCAKQCVLMKKKKGKKKPVYVVVKKKIKIPKHGRLVTVKRRIRTYKFTKCKAKSGSTLGTPVTINILDGSKAILDFGAFQREAPIHGSLKGFVPGGINLSSDSQVTLTKGALSLDPTALFIDDDCKGKVSAAIRTGNCSAQSWVSVPTPERPATMASQVDATSPPNGVVAPSPVTTTSGRDTVKPKPSRCTTRRRPRS